jgi:Rrf2 family transcriptional regulator, cysteine metabolism repressor
MMTISTRGRYATRIMALLASGAAKATLTKFQIAEHESISPAYVQQLLMALRMAGLVQSHRGRVGGFSIARAPETITVGDILAAVEGEILPAPCHNLEHCNRAATCPTRPVWERAAALLEDLFASVTVADLARGEGTPAP